MPSSLRYNEARAIMEDVDRLDRIYPEVIGFNDVTAMNWIFKYQGGATTNQLNTIRVQSFVGNQLVLTNLPAVASTRVLFASNDLIQIGNITHPFTSTTDVVRGAGATVTVTTNRPNIIPSTVTNLGITVGPACKFTMFCPNMPTYKLVPGAAVVSNGVVVSNALIEWSNSFDLYEYFGDLS
jgi:intracellular sulfur oxidation DsrE/DsrF family protein